MRGYGQIINFVIRTISTSMQCRCTSVKMMESKDKTIKSSRKKEGEGRAKFVRFSESNLIARFVNDVPLTVESAKPVRQFSSSRFVGPVISVQSIFESCVEYALFPINSYPKKYGQQKIFKKIEQLFNLPTSDVASKLQSLAGYQSVQLRLESQFAMLDRHPFYSQQSFEDNTRFELWREQQRVRIRKTQTKIEEKLERASTPRIPEKNYNHIEERIQYEFLLRLLVSASSDRDEEAKNRVKLEPFLQRLQQHIGSLNDEAVLDLVNFIERDDEGSSVKRYLTPLNSFSYWLLEEYEERMGLGRLYRHTGLLHLLLTTKSFSRERLALILWQMQLCAKEVKRTAYNRIELDDFRNITEMLIKDTDHMMLNLFRYYGDDKLGANLLNKILVMLFETSKTLKMEIFKTINYQEVIIFSLEYSIRSLYRDMLVSCEEEKEPITKNPEPTSTDEDKQLEKEIESKMEDLTSIPTFPGAKKRVSDRQLSPKQLSEMCRLIPSAVTKAAEYNRIFSTLDVDLQSECRRYFVKLLIEDVKRLVEGRTVEVSCVDLLELCCNFHDFKKQFENAVQELEDMGVADVTVQTLFGMLKKYWAIESLEALKLTFAKWLFKEKWEENVTPIVSIGKLFKQFEEYCKVIKRLEERDIFDDNEGMRKELRGLIGLGIKSYAEQVYNMYLHSFPSKIHDDLHYLLVPRAENLTKKAKRESASIEDRLKALKTASSPDMRIDSPKNAEVENAIRWLTPKITAAKKVTKFWRSNRVPITVAMCSQINTISFLLERTLEFNKDTQLETDLSSVITMLEQLEFSMLKMIAYCFNAFIPELVLQKRKYSEATQEVSSYLQAQFSTLQVNPKARATLREVSLLLLESVGKVNDKEMLSELRMLYKDYITSSASINNELIKTWGNVEVSNDNLSMSMDSLARTASFKFDNKKKKPL